MRGEERREGGCEGGGCEGEEDVRGEERREGQCEGRRV